MGRHRMARRMGALMVAGSVLGGAVLATAAPASASGDGHSCGPFGGHADDGLVTDVVHHQIEPLLGPGAPGVHATNCQLAYHEQILLEPEHRDQFVQNVLAILRAVTG